MRGNTVVAQELIRHHEVDVRVPDAQGMTPLHAACAYGSTDIVKLLINGGKLLSLNFIVRL